MTLHFLLFAQDVSQVFFAFQSVQKHHQVDVLIVPTLMKINSKWFGNLPLGHTYSLSVTERRVDARLYYSQAAALNHHILVILRKYNDTWLESILW